MNSRHFHFGLEFSILVMAAVFVASLPLPLRAQAPPCCSVTNIDANTGIVSAKVNATRQTFQFVVTNRTLLSQLRNGQAVYANFGTKQVSLDGRTVCCNIRNIGTAPPTSAAGTTGTSCSPESCAQQCGPYNNATKVQWQQCYQNCIACGKQPPPQNQCTSATGAVFPKYYVLGLVYAPPGCTSTSTLKCSTQSSVDYQASSTMGTKVSTSHSFKQGVSAKVNAGFGVPGVAQFGASVSGGYTSSSGDSNSQTISKSQSLDIKGSGNEDGVDHNQDEFLLLLNPAVAVSQGNTCDVTWYMGLNSSLGATEELYKLPVSYLKNPSSMPSNVAQQLQALKFNNSDYQTILGLDPFANGSTTISSRFLPTTYTFPYEPTIEATDCNGGVCSCISMTDSIKNDFQTDSGSSSQTDYNVGFSESASGIAAGIFNFGASSDQNFSWSSSSSTTDTTDLSQAASATIACPSVNYQGPTLVSVYWDTLFGSFMFLPTIIGSPQAMILTQGNVTDAYGKPVRHEAIQLRLGTKTYHTYTDSRGNYVFVGHSNVLRPATAQLAVRGIMQPVKLGSLQKMAIRVPR